MSDNFIGGLTLDDGSGIETRYECAYLDEDDTYIRYSLQLFTIVKDSSKFSSIDSVSWTLTFNNGDNKQDNDCSGDTIFKTMPSGEVQIYSGIVTLKKDADIHRPKLDIIYNGAMQGSTTSTVLNSTENWTLDIAVPSKNEVTISPNVIMVFPAKGNTVEYGEYALFDVDYTYNKGTAGSDMMIRHDHTDFVVEYPAGSGNTAIERTVNLIGGGGVGIKLIPSNFTGREGGEVVITFREFYHWFGALKYTQISFTLKANAMNVTPLTAKTKAGLIRVFGKNDKDFTSNGSVVINPLKAKVHKNDNGNYYLELEAPVKYIDYLVAGNIVVADTPQGSQAFRINNPEVTGNKISIKAWHVFYDSKNYLIADSYVVNMNANAALDHLNSSTEPSSEFVTVSDIQTVDSYRCVRKSLYEAIQTVIERWGGHLVRDNFKIGLMQNIGSENGVTVRFKKNLKDIRREENWENVVTKILPVGKDGILLNDLNSYDNLPFSGDTDIYIESSTKYDIPYTKTVSFSQEDIDENDYSDDFHYRKALVDNLREQATEYLKKHCVPEVNYTVKANIDKITDVGDVVNVIDERLGINVLTNVIGFTYDCILKKYTEVQFGNFKKSLDGFSNSVTADINKKVDASTSTAMRNVAQTVTDNITNSLSSSYVVYDGSRILVLDALPKEDAHNVILINNNGIAFSKNGINGPFTSAWAIDGTLNMQHINVINLVADMIKGGTLKLGTAANQSGRIELYDAANKLVCTLDSHGIIMYATNGGYVVLNQDVGLVGYDSLGNPIYWATGDEFHMHKAVVEDEITLCNKLRFIPMTITDSSGNVTSDGIGLVSSYSSSEGVI